MDQCVLRLLTVALVFVNLHSALTTISGKQGSCPSVQGQVGLCVEMCSTDTECEGNLKCCSNGCGHVCMQPELPAKPGVCPRPIPHLTTCEDKCFADSDCDANQKCCYSGCGMHCVKPRPHKGKKGGRKDK